MKSRPAKCSSLTRPGQFEAVMSVKPCARSPHFVVHFLPATEKEVLKLSTASVPHLEGAVDDWMDVQFGGPDGALHLGLIVSKRNARRAVTRNTIKRHWRQAIRDRADRLPRGDWVVRLRAVVDRKRFPSAKSAVLADVLRDEVHAVLEDAIRRVIRGAALSRPGVSSAQRGEPPAIAGGA